MGSFSAPLGSLGVSITGDPTDALAALDKVVEATEKANQDMSRMDFAAGIADSVSKNMDEVRKQFDGLADVGAGMMTVGAGLTAAITAPLLGIGVAAVSTAEQLNTAKVAFTTMLGSAEAADAMLTSLQQFAATTPFEFPDLVSSAQRMKALGFSAEQIIPTLRTVGDTAAAMGKGKEAIDGITKALGDIQMKGKVSAEEMQQLAERGIPAWDILAKAIGVKIPEAMKLAEKGAIEASQAVPALLAGMNEKFGGSMDAMSKTLTGQWSNLKDQLTLALIPIGQTLIPALQSLLPVLTGVLEKVGEAVTWFQQLPGPVQAAAGTVAVFAAAIGPVVGILGAIASAVAAAMPALTAVAGFFGTSVALLAPWALAIGAVLAALVALGTWVHQNWAPITAVLKQAWEGIEENWTAVWNGIANATKAIWGPIVSFFTTIWDAVAPYFKKAWDAIAGALSTVWNGIKATASAVWNGITAVFQKFLEWAAKIPGVNKLLNLDEAWKSAEKAAKGLNETADAAKKTGDASAAAAPKIKLVAGANKEAEAAAKKAAKAAGDHARAVADAWDAAHKRYDAMAAEFTKTLKWFEDAYAKIKELDGQIAKSASDLAADYARSHEAMRQAALKTVEIVVPLQKRIPEGVQDAIKKNKELEEAYKTLGLESAAALNKLYGEAKKAYEKIAAASGETSAEAQRAWIAMEEARVKATIAAGGAITESQRKTLEDMKKLYPPLEDATKKHHDKQKDLWKKFGEDVKQTVGDFMSGVMSRLIFGGDDTNKRLDEEADALRASLAERGEEWDAYVAEVGQKQQTLTDDYQKALTAEDDALRDSLADRAAEHERFVQKESEDYDKDLAELRDSFDERTEAFEEYQSDVAEHMEEFRRDAADRLADETRDLLDEFAERQEAYDDFVEDANKKLNRIGEQTADNIEDETRDTGRSIRDKQKDYDRYAEDVAGKIAELRQKNGGQVTKEETDLRTSLARRQQDLAQYIADQQEDLADFTEEQRTRQAQEEADLKTSMERKERDHTEYIAGVIAKFAENEQAYKDSLAKEETAQQESLAKKKTEYDKFVVENKTAQDQLAIDHKAALDTEETDYTQFVNDTTAESERRKNEIKADYEADTATLNTELAKQKKEYENFVTGITGEGGELDKIREAHKTLWGDIAELGKAAFGSIADSMLHLISEEVMGAVIKGILGEAGFGGLGKALGGIFSGIFGGGGEAAGSAIGGVAGAAGSAGSSVAGAAGQAAGMGLQGVMGIVTGAVSAISGVIGNFQFAAMNKSLDLIERYTRFSEIHLKHILEDGVNKWLAKLDTINGWLWDTFTPAFASLMSTTEDIPGKIQKTNDNLADWLKPIYTDTWGKWQVYEDRLYEISDHGFWIGQDVHAMQMDLASVKGYLDTTKNNTQRMADKMTGGAAWTVTFTGDPIARLVGDEIMRQLRMQGINLV